MDFVSCPFCGQSGENTLIWKIPDRLWFPERYFGLVRCDRCAFVYLNPRPIKKEMKQYYPNFTHSLASFPKVMPPAFLWRFRQIENRQKGGRLLDVGCGNGLFLVFALERGWDGYGLDNSASAIQMARQRLDDRVTLTTLLETCYSSNSFDVVSFFEVLEHLPSPTDYLREVHRILKPGGWICISVPNFASLERSIFRKWWIGLDAPRHLQQFNPNSLRLILENAGFEVVELISINADKIQMKKKNITYCQESFRYFLRDFGRYPRRIPPMPENFSKDNKQQSALWKRGIHWLEWMIFHPLCILAHAFDKDNTLWAWGRKP